MAFRIRGGKKVHIAEAHQTSWRKAVDDIAVRKNCTIPNWLNKKAVKSRKV